MQDFFHQQYASFDLIFGSSGFIMCVPCYGQMFSDDRPGDMRAINSHKLQEEEHHLKVEWMPVQLAYFMIMCIYLGKL